MTTRLAVKLERFRRHRDMTQAKVAAKIGVTREYVSLLEQGHRTPSLDTLKKLARLFDVEIGDLLQ